MMLGFLWHRWLDLAGQAQGKERLNLLARHVISRWGQHARQRMRLTSLWMSRGVHVQIECEADC